VSDAQQITLLVDGEETKVTTGTTGAELFFERRDVVVARVNGELKDLDQQLPKAPRLRVSPSIPRTG
jgi:threonyl-tRNA synthetase